MFFKKEPPIMKCSIAIKNKTRGSFLTLSFVPVPIPMVLLAVQIQLLCHLLLCVSHAVLPVLVDLFLL